MNLSPSSDAQFSDQPSGPRILVAMDVNNLDACLSLADQLDPQYCRLKVGKELFTACGPQVVEQLHKRGFQVFLDLKFHDIPVTVAKAVQAAAALGVWMVNIHTLGGPRMLEAAAEALAPMREPPLLIGVTLLTSMTATEVKAVGINRPLPEQVVALAGLAQECGLRGVVCSAQEAAALQSACGPEFVLVTPGIRPAGAAVDDQRRIMTPEQAVAAGSHYLVVGRPITQASDPTGVCREIADAIEAVGRS